MKRHVTSLALILVLVGAFPHGRKVEAGSQRTYRQISFVDDFTNEYEYPEILYIDEGRSTSSNIFRNQCTNGLSDPLCDPLSSKLLVRNVLTTCSRTDFGPCIESVEARQQNGGWISGEYIGSRANPQKWFAGNERFQFSHANESNLFVFSGIQHVEGTTFEVIPYMQQKIEFGTSPGLESLSIKIQGVARNFSANTDRPCIRTPNCSGVNSIVEDGACIQSTMNPLRDCWKIARVPNDIEFRLVLKLKQQPKGWITGRMFNPGIDVTPIVGSNDLGYLVTITGNPISAPTISRRYFSDNPSERRDWSELSLLPYFSHVGSWEDTTNWIQLLNSSRSFGVLKTLINLDSSFDQATSIRDIWSANLTWTNLWEESQCGLDELIGFISSNALTFKSKIPVFDEKTQVLSYQVESPHLDAAGRTYEGVYSLLLSKNYANCLWKLSSPNLVGQIEVLDQDGQKKSVISTISIDSKQVRFVASGFSYSAPSISVSVSEVKSTRAVTSKVIQCKKGTTVKKVVGKNPKCPKGFRRL